MSYQEMDEVYRNLPERNRAFMCIRQQAVAISADPDPEKSALARSIVGGNLGDIESVFVALCTGKHYDDWKTDAALLAAVLEVWPEVAAALFPEGSPVGVLEHRASIPPGTISP